jgi:hypothetical protein
VLAKFGRKNHTTTLWDYTASSRTFFYAFAFTLHSALSRRREVTEMKEQYS